MNARQAAELAISVARRAGITSTPLSIEARGARTVVIFATHVAFVAHDDATTRKTAGERLVLNRLAGRLPVAIPLPVLADGPVCLRTKVLVSGTISTHSRMARLATRTPEITARSWRRCTRRFRPTS